MRYSHLKTKLIALFDPQKLDGTLNDEWGFLNESNKDIKKIGYATSLTDDIVKAAAKNNVDLIITHHDAWHFVYGMKEKCAELLAKHNIIHAWFHLPLDDADFGTSSSIAKALRLANCKKANPAGKYLCSVIGEIESPAAFEDFSKGLSDILQEPLRAYQNNSSPIHIVCITGGAGYSTDDIKVALENGCDTYITGEYTLYAQQYAKLIGINLLVGSHTNTEILGVHELVSRLSADTDIEYVRLAEDNY